MQHITLVNLLLTRGRIYVLTINPERHLEKTPIGYIQWRFQDGHDREFCCLWLFAIH